MDRRPLLCENLTVAVLFRVVDQYQPTLLLDEYDGWIWENEELRTLLNAGHSHTGQACRCVGDDHEVHAFRVFAPAVLAGIGKLPGTLADRSIQIRLVRAKPGEVTARFDSRHTETEQELARKLARWAADLVNRGGPRRRLASPRARRLQPDSSDRRLGLARCGRKAPRRHSIRFSREADRQDLLENAHRVPQRPRGWAVVRDPKGTADHPVLVGRKTEVVQDLSGKHSHWRSSGEGIHAGGLRGSLRAVPAGGGVARPSHRPKP